jgi:hypothetical protein
MKTLNKGIQEDIGIRNTSHVYRSEKSIKMDIFSK